MTKPVTILVVMALSAQALPEKERFEFYMIFLAANVLIVACNCEQYIKGLSRAQALDKEEKIKEDQKLRAQGATRGEADICRIGE